VLEVVRGVREKGGGGGGGELDYCVKNLRMLSASFLTTTQDTRFSWSLVLICKYIKVFK